MKLKFKQSAIILVLTLAALVNTNQLSAQENSVNFQVFYDALSPYGQWVDYQDYGYVWIPDVGPDFAPYSTNGYWTLTDYGWTWVSDYDWGWAPFHYGRWDYDNYYGWLWVPDNEWGPSWVNWRRADGYYGWSPMEPGISINLSFNRPYNSYNDHWMFVRDMDFERRDINRYSVDRSDHAMIFRNSTVINQTYNDYSRHTTYVTGPAREDVQRVTGRRISPVAIQENNRPGRDQNNGQLRMYRPQVVKNGGFDRRPAPKRVENLEDVKRPSERNASAQPRNNNQRNNNDIQQRQPRDLSPINNNERQQQNNNMRQQNINRSQPSQQPQQAAPARNNERQQQNMSRPQNINRSQPSQQPQQTAPAGNNERQQQNNNMRQQNINRSQPSQQPQQTAPAENKQRQQQNTARPQNINRSQPSQQPQQAAPARNNVRQQPSTTKQQNQKQRENRSGDEKKQND